MSRNTALIISIIAALGTCNLAIGLLVQVIPLAMDAEGDSKFLIGNNAMVGQSGVMLAGFLLVWARQHFKSHRLVLAGLALSLFCYLGFAVSTPLYWWFALRFLVGVTIATVFTTGESWLQHHASDSTRGRVMGTYMTSQTLTFALGPFLLRYIGFAGSLPWILGAVAIGLSLLLALRLDVVETAHGEKAAPLFITLRKAGFAFLCVGVVTFFEAFMLTFFTLYAVQNGFETGTATQLLAFGIAACVLFFFGIGYAGDHWSRMGTIGICAGLAIVFSLVQIPTMATIWIWPVVAIVRAAAFGVYLCGFGLQGDRFKGREMVATSSINSIMWGASGMIGPPLAGLAFDTYGLWLLPWLMAVCFVPVLLGLTTQIARTA